jgi:uridine kinase
LRKRLISKIAARILSLELHHPVRVGVSGITASGKTTFADELAEALSARKRKVVRTSIDNFHHPKVIRYRQGKESAKGYYEDAHDYLAFMEKLLIPLGPGGSLHYQEISLDLPSDEYVTQALKVSDMDSIFIIDGTFLFKKELNNHYDVKIFVGTDFEIARKRGAKREELNFGSYEKAEEMFLKRYHAASRLYLDQHSPQHYADVVINNDDLFNPYFEGFLKNTKREE